MNPNDKLKKLEELLKILDEGVTREEFKSAFAEVLKVVQNINEGNIKGRDKLEQSISTLSDALKGDISTELHTQISAALQTIQAKLDTVKDGKEGARGPAGKNGRDGEKGKDGRNGRDGRDGERGPAGKDGVSGGTHIGWGAHPLLIQGLGITIDKNTRVINFKGIGLGSVTRRKDGVVEVSISGGNASGGTLVSEEVPTDSGDHTTFTLANTPDTGTLRVYRGGARQQSIGATPDYTLVGTSLTLTTVLNTAGGEILLVDYQYT